MPLWGMGGGAFDVAAATRQAVRRTLHAAFGLIAGFPCSVINTGSPVLFDLKIVVRLAVQPEPRCGVAFPSMTLSAYQPYPVGGDPHVCRLPLQYLLYSQAGTRR
jgi:hypothetical protein